MTERCDTCRYWTETGIERSGIQMPHGIPAEWCYRVGYCSQRDMPVAEWQGCWHHKRRRGQR